MCHCLHLSLCVFCLSRDCNTSIYCASCVCACVRACACFAAVSGRCWPIVTNLFADPKQNKAEKQPHPSPPEQSMRYGVGCGGRSRSTKTKPILPGLLASEAHTKKQTCSSPLLFTHTHTHSLTHTHTLSLSLFVPETTRQQPAHC